MRISIRPEWLLERPPGQSGGPISLPALLQLLGGIQQGGSISEAARAAGLSYRGAWGMLRDFEHEFGAPLVIKTRGQGTRLSPLAEKLLWADRRIAARLSPTLQSLASELEGELEELLAGKHPHARHGVRINASHGFAVAALVEALGAAGVAVELKYRNSTEAVAALARGECDLAGFHVPMGEFQRGSVTQYTRWLNPRRHVLIHLALRTQGLFVAKDNPMSVRGLDDLVRANLRFVNRQVGSGTRMLLEQLLARRGIEPKSINGYESAEFTHAAVAAYIASGMADAGFGVEMAARRFGLDFIPVVRERYFFACEAKAADQPHMRQVLALMKSRAFRQVVDGLAGYDGAESGRVLTLAEAFDA